MTDPALEKEATRLLTNRVEFLLSAPQLKFLPDGNVPEVAFAGRSNVGKSSLLNALVGRRAIARTSNTPGRTQELNFFDIGDPLELRLVDMPGYGFAKAPLKVVDRWKQLIMSYLRDRAALKRTMVLIDSRRGIGPVDTEMMAMLDKAAVSYNLVLTKADKVKTSELAQVTDAVTEASKKHPAAHPKLYVTSSEKGLGIPELRAAVLEASRL